MTKYFHPNAASNFNERAHELVSEIGKFEDNDPKHEGFPTDRPVRTISEDEVVGSFKLQSRDVFGQEYSRFEEVEGELLGLSENMYPQFHQLCESIFRSKGVMKYVSSETVKEKTLSWLIARNQLNCDSDLCTYLEEAFEGVVEVVSLILPVFGTETEEAFQIGHIKFQNITEQEFNRWVEESCRDREDDERKLMLESFERERKQVQGLMAARITLKADPMRAKEIALELAEDALAMLRSFHPSNVEPRLNGHTALLGKQLLVTDRIIIPLDGRGVKTSESIAENGLPTWRIDRKLKEMMFGGGLSVLHEIIRTPQKSRTEFQTLVLDTMRIYSRVSLAKTYADKVIYMLVSLESVLLKDDKEFIQQSIADRLAFAIEKDKVKRIRIVEVVKEIYGLRSRFLHHGKHISSEKIELMKEFMVYLWEYHHYLIVNSNNFNTKTEMIQSIEAIKYSG